MSTGTKIAENAAHRVVSAWKGDEPGSCGFECACGDVFDGFDSIGEAEACHRPLKGWVETPPADMPDKPEPDECEPAQVDPDPRTEYIAGLRMLADLLEQNPHLKLPFYGHISPMRVLVCNEEQQEQRDQLAAWVKALPGRKDKSEGGTKGDFLMVSAKLRGLDFEIQADRDDVCERVVVGIKTETKVVKDPALLAEVPEVEVTEEVEIVEWRCGSILSAVSS
jgi:hypothetical protein